MLRFCVHYGIHFLLPIIVGLIFYKKHRLLIIAILLAGILIDVDHLWANPIFDHNRCSINFHPLHTYWAISGYCLLLFFQKTRVFGIAFLIHILADMADCYLM
ncbi:hypothetical protein DHD32_01015 [Arenibacter sp. TNZ]|uniref:DUF6122 family protein n=1 Tax=Arenibacter TaxID=178469 RepID=UPI000CD44C52|nr:MULTISPECIES: DUF6122 family protein [Arenibacter]MCM4170044.1 hypothetical protein [Arenibacter sp. TNZ]